MLKSKRKMLLKVFRELIIYRKATIDCFEKIKSALYGSRDGR
jgi:hypothetical protein